MPTKEFRKLFGDTVDLFHITICELTLAENTEFYQLLREYYTFIHERTQTLFLLVQNDCLWDADIILRPIAECTVKFAFVSSTARIYNRNDSAEMLSVPTKKI
jgi:hypothetical protein